MTKFTGSLFLLHRHRLAGSQVSWEGAVMEPLSLKCISPVSVESPQEAE